MPQASAIRTNEIVGAMTSMTTAGLSADVVVVGGGVIGMSVALALAERGAAVTVVERDALGGSASWAGGGILSPLPPTQRATQPDALLERSLQLYPDWCERLASLSGIDPEYWDCGAVYYPDGGEAVRFPEISQVRNPRLLKALAASLKLRGARLLTGVSAIGWRVERGVLQGLDTSAGFLGCRRAVAAAGAWSSELGAEGIRPIKGQMLLFRVAPDALSQILIGDHAYVVPRRDGRLLVGSTLEDAGFDTEPTSEALRELSRRGGLLWPPLATLRPVAHWAGLRPCPDQGQPLLRAAPAVQGLHLATGHHRLGITLAPATAERIAAAIDAS